MLLTQNTHADVVKCRFFQAIFSPRWLNSPLSRQNNNVSDPPPRKAGCLVILPLFYSQITFTESLVYSNSELMINELTISLTEHFKI